ncbi:MAG: hypothetical protein WA666_01560 [Nitrospirota bacterium]
MGREEKLSGLCVSEMSEGEIALLRSEMASSPKVGRIGEIGTAAGGTLVRLIKDFPPEELARVMVVESFNYFENQLGVFRDNLMHHGIDPERLDVRIGMSLDAFRKAREKGERFSFIIIDASHKLKYVTQDLQWLCLLDAGGKAAIHDYHENIPGVMLAVDIFLRRNPNYRRKELKDSLLILEKTSESTKCEVSRVNLLFASLYSNMLHNKQALKKKWGKK